MELLMTKEYFNDLCVCNKLSKPLLSDVCTQEYLHNLLNK